MPQHQPFPRPSNFEAHVAVSVKEAALDLFGNHVLLEVVLVQSLVGGQPIQELPVNSDGSGRNHGTHKRDALRVGLVVFVQLLIESEELSLIGVGSF